VRAGRRAKIRLADLGHQLDGKGVGFSGVEKI
jgi:hypothetical protein